MKYIKRPFYFKQIEPYIGDSLIKVIVGQRRVGKSNIMLQLRDEISTRFPADLIIYINKEDYAFDQLRDYNDLMDFLKPSIDSRQKVHLFIDEVQEIFQFEKAIRSLQLNEQFDIYCTGSNATLLSGELATFLAGRYIEFRIYSLTYNEFLIFHQKSDSAESFMKYLQYGGMPHLVNLRESEEVYYEYLRNIYDSIILRDVVSRYKLRNIRMLNNLIQFLADNVGSLFSANSVSSFLKSQHLSIQTKSILEYLEFLQNVFFIDGVKRTEIGGKKIFEIGEKYFFEDIGMRNAIIPFKLQDINKLLENVVYHHLKCMQFDVKIGQLGTKEIDFVATKNDLKYYIQVAYLITEETTIKREFGNLELIKDNYPKFVISMDDLPKSNTNGIQHWNIRKFLMEFGIKPFFE